MVLETDFMKLPVGSQVIPSQEFAAYCEAEFERRANSGQPFDEAGYREAMEMVKRALEILEAEGKA